MSHSSHSRRFLLIDDDPQIRKLVERELREASPAAIVVEATDSRQLADALDSPPYDLVVTDYFLGWSDGLKVLSSVKGRWPNCPVIMFTGTGNEEVAVAAMKLGLDDYIIKNARHLVRLRVAVEACLRNAETRIREETLTSRLSMLLSQLEVGVFSCAPDGELVEASPSLLRLLGCESLEKLQSSEFADLIRKHVESSAETVGDSAAAGRFEGELQIEEDAATQRIFKISAGPSAATGRIYRIDGLVEDVTLRRQAELATRAAAVAEARLATLSPREREVFDLVVAGLANKAIARRLDISDKTVEKHRASVMKKLQSRSVAELVRLSVPPSRAAAR